MKKIVVAAILFIFLSISVGNAHSPFINSVRNSEFSKETLNETNCNDNLHFYGHSNNSCYVVALSSPSEIYLEDFDYRIMIFPAIKKNFSNAFFTGVFLTNGTFFSGGLGGGSESNQFGNLRYLHFKFGNLNFTYSDRMLYNVTGWQGEYYTEPYNHTLPPGKWYFIFTGGFFDLSQNDTLVNISVWMNFSNKCKDLNISTSEGGKIYALWYGEFDANVIISKAWRFEMMLNGKKKFHINNTFIYYFWSWPTAQGFWRVKWIKPGGEISKLNMIIFRELHFPDIATSECERGIGGSGDYELTTSYLDYSPILFGKHIYACPIYFVGIDLKLP